MHKTRELTAAAILVAPFLLGWRNAIVQRKDGNAHTGSYGGKRCWSAYGMSDLRQGRTAPLGNITRYEEIL